MFFAIIIYNFKYTCASLYTVHDILLHCAAILTLRQSRTPPGGATSTTTVIGIATVELGGLSTSQPTYYFDCITNSNNGSGIRWDRTSTLNRFQVIDIPDGSPGKRLDTADINYPDLDIYICSDRYSNDVASVNITASELIPGHTHTHFACIHHVWKL